MTEQELGTKSRNHKLLKRAASAVVVAGLLLHGGIVLTKFEHGLTVSSFAFLVWLWTPYILALGLIAFVQEPTIPLIGAIGPLIFDAFVHYSVFIEPSSSTSAIGLLWMPLWDLVLIEPLGLLIGRAIAR